VPEPYREIGHDRSVRTATDIPALPWERREHRIVPADKVTR
jgi:hypothetical protein